MTPLPLSVALVMATGAACAQTPCPTQGDLARGIELVRNDPFYSNVMTLTDGGLTEARIAARGGAVEAVSTTYAHALAVTERIGSNGTLELVYAGDTFEMDQLQHLGQWNSHVSLVRDGTASTTGTFRATFMEAVDFPMGTCSYVVWHIRTELALDGSPPILQDRYYAPTLGLSLGTVSLDAQANPISGVFFDEIIAR